MEVWTRPMAGVTFVITAPPHSLEYATNKQKLNTKHGCVAQIVSTATLVILQLSKLNSEHLLLKADGKSTSVNSKICFK